MKYKGIVMKLKFLVFACLLTLFFSCDSLLFRDIEFINNSSYKLFITAHDQHYIDVGFYLMPGESKIESFSRNDHIEYSYDHISYVYSDIYVANTIVFKDYIKKP